MATRQPLQHLDTNRENNDAAEAPRGRSKQKSTLAIRHRKALRTLMQNDFERGLSPHANSSISEDQENYHAQKHRSVKQKKTKLTTRRRPELGLEYVDDTMSYFLSIEGNFLVPRDFLDNRKINIYLRCDLVDKMISLHRTLYYCDDVLHLWINIVDRFLYRRPDLKPECLNLVGTAALDLSTRVEGIGCIMFLTSYNVLNFYFPSPYFHMGKENC